jgi:hypothetical protein
MAIPDLPFTLTPLMDGQIPTKLTTPEVQPAMSESEARALVVRMDQDIRRQIDYLFSR